MVSSAPARETETLDSMLKALARATWAAACTAEPPPVMRNAAVSAGQSAARTEIPSRPAHATLERISLWARWTTYSGMLAKDCAPRTVLALGEERIHWT